MRKANKLVCILINKGSSVFKIVFYQNYLSKIKDAMENKAYQKTQAGGRFQTNKGCHPSQ